MRIHRNDVLFEHHDVQKANPEKNKLYLRCEETGTDGGMMKKLLPKQVSAIRTSAKYMYYVGKCSLSGQ